MGKACERRGEKGCEDEEVRIRWRRLVREKKKVCSGEERKVSGAVDVKLVW